MMTERSYLFVRIGSALALALVIAGCTRGGQFDPTEVFSADMFDTKKKLQGDREPVFPQGVPGTQTGVPQDLVKGYQPPPEPAENAEAPPPEPAKPRPKIARAPAEPQAQPQPQAQEQAAKQKPPKRTQITVGRAPASGAPTNAAASQAPWPAAPQAAAPAPQAAAPAPQAAGQAPPAWPSPQQAAQPAQSVWPNPPAPSH
jgi:outer membrane biosynthesis protein TonB